jgi:pyruvate formate lyase activating enzyme
VTFSGGEPLSQGAFLLELLKASKRLELHTALDTCGLASWETLDRVRTYVDLFLYDLKLTDDRQHRKFTGVSNRLILDNLEKLANSGHNITVRVPVIPGITDGAENIRTIGSLAARLGIGQVDLLPYHPTAQGKYERLNKAYALPDIQTPGNGAMQKMASQLAGYALNVTIGG